MNATSQTANNPTDELTRATDLERTIFYFRTAPRLYDHLLLVWKCCELHRWLYPFMQTENEDNQMEVKAAERDKFVSIETMNRTRTTHAGLWISSRLCAENRSSQQKQFCLVSFSSRPLDFPLHGETSNSSQTVMFRVTCRHSCSKTLIYCLDWSAFSSGGMFSACFAMTSCIGTRRLKDSNTCPRHWISDVLAVLNSLHG